MDENTAAIILQRRLYWDKVERRERALQKDEKKDLSYILNAIIKIQCRFRWKKKRKKKEIEKRLHEAKVRKQRQDAYINEMLERSTTHKRINATTDVKIDKKSIGNMHQFKAMKYIRPKHINRLLATHVDVSSTGCDTKKEILLVKMRNSSPQNLTIATTSATTAIATSVATSDGDTAKVHTLLKMNDHGGSSSDNVSKSVVYATKQLDNSSSVVSNAEPSDYNSINDKIVSAVTDIVHILGSLTSIDSSDSRSSKSSKIVANQVNSIKSNNSSRKYGNSGGGFTDDHRLIDGYQYLNGLCSNAMVDIDEQLQTDIAAIAATIPAKPGGKSSSYYKYSLLASKRFANTHKYNNILSSDIVDVYSSNEDDTAYKADAAGINRNTKSIALPVPIDKTTSTATWNSSSNHGTGANADGYKSNKWAVVKMNHSQHDEALKQRIRDSSRENYLLARQAKEQQKRLELDDFVIDDSVGNTASHRYINRPPKSIKSSKNISRRM